jgi:hypothetical protein
MVGYKRAILLFSFLHLTFAALRPESESVGASMCPKYVCATEQQKYNMLEFQCALYSGDGVGTYTIKACPDGYECYCLNQEDSSCVPIQPSTTNATGVYPGELCETDSDCLSSNCVQDLRLNRKICEGANKGDSCNANKDCNPGLYCSSISGACTYLRQFGQSCENDF